MQLPVAAAACLLLSAALLALQLPGTAAHAGHFHPWPIQAVRPETGSAVLVGSCSNWVLPGRATAAASIVDSSSSSSNVTITGTAKLWQYLLENCTGAYTAGLELDLVFRYRDGSPLMRVPVGGHTRTGSCAAGGGDIYLLNPAAGQVVENQLWVARANTRPNGTFHGTSPNSGNLTTGGTNGVRSVILSNAVTHSVYGCCDFVIPNPGANYAAQLVGKGKPCDTAALEETVHGLSAGDDSSSLADTPAAATTSPAAAPAPTAAATTTGSPVSSGAASVFVGAGAAVMAAAAALLLA